MSGDFEVHGADQFLRLSKALKHAGRGELRKELNKRLREAAKPLTAETRAAALAGLPKRGGLNRAVAQAPQRVQVRTGDQTAGVRVVVASKRGTAARGSDEGVIRHPVFGDRGTFVSQQVPPGWFSGTLQAKAPTVKPAVERAIQTVIDDIVKEAG